MLLNITWKEKYQKWEKNEKKSKFLLITTMFQPGNMPMQ